MFSSGRLNFALLTLILALGSGCRSADSQRESSTGLEIEYGSKGLERLTFHGHVLEDTQRWPGDQFHIWHMKCLSPDGTDLKQSGCEWGETATSRVWDPAKKTWSYSFPWGKLQSRYVQRGDSLDVEITAKNRSDSGLILDGATLYPLTLHLPALADPFSAGGSRLTDGSNQPGVTRAVWSGGQIFAVVPGMDRKLWSGLQSPSKGVLAAVVSSTLPDGVPGAAATAGGMALRPGQSATFTFSVRFAAGSASDQATADVDRNFRSRWPHTLHWTDRRPIGTVYLASSAQGNKTERAGFRTNPRRYFKDPDLNVEDAAARARFQARVLQAAQEVVRNLQRMEGQGAITWDIEGEQYPQDTSYVCSPDKIGMAAPEMEVVIADASSKYRGMKLDDAYFRIIREAGFRVGVCVRPQRFELAADGTAHQTTLPDADAAAELMRKMRYAHDRWGATLFYADSTVQADGNTLPAEVLEKAAAALPDSLLIPEESSVRMYRAMAPFKTFLFHGDLGTTESTRRVYPDAFSVNLVNDVSPAALTEHHVDLVDAVRHGDVLMIHADFWQANNPIIVGIYREARQAGSDPTH